MTRGSVGDAAAVREGHRLMGRDVGGGFAAAAEAVSHSGQPGPVFYHTQEPESSAESPKRASGERLFHSSWKPVGVMDSGLFGRQHPSNKWV